MPTRASQRHLDRAAYDWDWACHQLEVDDRPPILANHDRHVLAWLSVIAERGSNILDALVAIEHDRLSDAELAQRARAFKQAYVRDQAIQSDVPALERAWRAFQSAPAE